MVLNISKKRVSTILRSFGREVEPRFAANVIVITPYSRGLLPLGIEQTARTAGAFAGAVRAKRDTLQTLYYSAKNSWTEARSLRARYDALPPFDPYEHALNGSTDVGHSTLLDAAIAAEVTAQDSAAAFIMICDYSLQRINAEGLTVDTRTIGGEAYNGVKLNRAIWALANQTRHLHKWQQNDWHQESYNVLVSLQLRPTYPDAARLFLEKLELSAYVDFEERLTATAEDLLQGTGLQLTRFGPGIVTMTIRADLGSAPP